MPHQRLLHKLKAHGIGDGLIDWIEQWLTDRKLRVVVEGEVSKWKLVLSGVPQGSVLRPLLFLIYINDLDDNITSNVLIFADDTKVFRKVNTDGDKQHLQNDIDILVKWSEKWQMLLNFGTCKCLHTGHGNMDVNYKMVDTVLGTTVKEKDLGVTISADMKECGLTTLETRRLRGDQIEVLKILNGYENIDRNMFFSLKKDSRTRGHGVKLGKGQCRLDIRKYSFSQRTVNEWNKLSTDCITVSSVNMFKNKFFFFLRSVVIPAASVSVGSSGQGQLKYIAPLLGQQWVFLG